MPEIEQTETHLWLGNPPSLRLRRICGQLETYETPKQKYVDSCVGSIAHLLWSGVLPSLVDRLNGWGSFEFGQHVCCWIHL